MSERTSEKRVMLIRHAQTDWNAAGRWQGHADPSLSAEGQVQARLLGERLTGESAVALVCSDLKRAVQTATPVAQALGLELIEDQRFSKMPRQFGMAFHNRHFPGAIAFISRLKALCDTDSKCRNQLQRKR